MKKNKTRGLLGLLLCLALLIFAATHLYLVEDVLQYLVIAPAPQNQEAFQGALMEGEESKEGEDKAPLPYQALEDLQENLDETAQMEWATAIKSYAIEGIISSTRFSAPGKNGAEGRLTALGKNSLEIYPLIPREGRLIYPEEFNQGDKVVMIDEQLALAVFSNANPVGEYMLIESEPYRVVGVIRHSKKMGDERDYGAYIPLLSLVDQALPLEALMISAIPIANAGADSAFISIIENNLQLKGTFINLKKEAMGAMMPLRVLLFAIGLIIMLALIKWLNKKVLAFIDDYKRRLEHVYAPRLLPRLFIGVVLLGAGYGLSALVLAKLVQYMLVPVYTFPEWIPDVLVAWSEIKKSFWNVWQGQAALIDIRSPQLLAIQFYHFVIGWSTAGFALFLMYSYYEKRKQITLRKQEVK